MTTIAFFDLDYTLLNTSSGLEYLREIIWQRRAPLWLVGYIGVRYRLNSLDFGEANAWLIKHVGKHGKTEAVQFFRQWVAKRVFPRLTPSGKAQIAWHKKQGHQVIILSASIEEIVQPVTQYLGLEMDYLCTHLAVVNDHYTGKLDGPLCYGVGKVHWAKQWCMQNKLNFPESAGYFYTDSSSDVPLLELVQHPIAVNPSPKLAKIAKSRGWPIVTW